MCCRACADNKHTLADCLFCGEEPQLHYIGPPPKKRRGLGGRSHVLERPYTVVGGGQPPLTPPFDPPPPPPLLMCN